MSYAPAAIALITPVLLSIGVVRAPLDASAESMRRKCRNAVQTTPVHFLDGRSSSDAAMRGIDSGNVLYVMVTCLNPIDSTLLGAASTALGIPAVVVWTKSSPMNQLEPVLNAVRDAQNAHIARTGAYSRDIAALPLPALPAEVKMSLVATPSGWSATAWVDRRLSPRCRVFDGDVQGRIPGSRGAVACSDN